MKTDWLKRFAPQRRIRVSPIPTRIVVGLLALIPLLGRSQSQSAEIPDRDLLDHTIISIPLDRIGAYSDGTEPVAIKWARAAMDNPQLAWELRQKLKSPERHSAEQSAALAILDPEEFRRRRDLEAAERGPKTADQLAIEAEAARARQEVLQRMLNPLEAAREKDKGKDAATRRREAIAEFAILNPREFNRRVDRHKSIELQNREADVIHAFVDPVSFQRERERLQKTGSKTAVKSDDSKPEPKLPASNRETKGAEKGTNGGRP